ncbi:phage tail tube protein [Paeniglutamicibacter sp.]|uniref:phage tail tube protein n=1 Tax=Paeniglutamicibacter sp. TaxID=1934391 RepID=UPI0039893F27
MTTQLDCSIGLQQETAYGVPGTPAQFVEFISESLVWEPEIVQGEGLRVGSRVPREKRRVLVKDQASGDIELEASTKGLGIFLAALFGNSSIAQVGSTGAYQQVHKLTTTDPIPSFTIQKGVPLLGGGAIQAHTFHGAVCASGEFAAAAGEIVKLTTSWNAREIVTDTAYVPPVYPVNAELFTFVHGAITIGGTITHPTATAPATGGTVAGNVTDFSLSIANTLDEGGFTFGSEGKRGRKPVVGLAELTGSITAEYDNNMLRDAYLQQLPLSLVLTFEHPVEISAGVKPTLQLVMESIKLDGQIPASNGGEPIAQEIDYVVLDSLATGVAPLTAVYVSTDTAI